jgi:hypothetical protein
LSILIGSLSSNSAAIVTALTSITIAFPKTIPENQMEINYVANYIHKINMCILTVVVFIKLFQY